MPFMTLYGAVEISPFFAAECEVRNGMHINADQGILEIVDPETGKQLGSGEEGEVVLTSFNTSRPLVRLAEGDLSYYLDYESCPCGRTSKKLAGVTGRVGTAVKVRGMFLHPNEVEETLFKFPWVSRYEVRVRLKEMKDEMILNIEPKEEITDKESLTQELSQAIQQRCKVRPNIIEFVAKGSISDEDNKRIKDERIWD